MDRLRSRGLRAEIPDPGKQKEASGEEVRRIIRSGGSWERPVQEATARSIRGLLENDPSRLRPT